MKIRKVMISLALAALLTIPVHIAPGIAAPVSSLNADLDFWTEFGALLEGDGNIYFGTYDHAVSLAEGTYGAASKEGVERPILWRALGEEEGDGAVTMISKYVLDSLAFHEGFRNKSNVYDLSGVKTFLNTGFAKSLSAAESGAVRPVNVATRMFDLTKTERTGEQQGSIYPVVSADQSFYLPWGNIRTNSVNWTAEFAPENYEDYRLTENKAQLRSGAGTNEYVYYWLRSPYFASNAALFVPESGMGTLSIASAGFEYGVRPLFKLEPENLVFASEILSDVSGRPDATLADSNYAASAEGSRNYKLTVTGTDLELTGVYANGKAVGSEEHPAVYAAPGGLLELKGVPNDTANTSINYKILDADGALAGYGVGKALLTDGENTAAIKADALDGTPLPKGGYTVFAWLQRSNETNSNEASPPLRFSMAVAEADGTPKFTDRSGAELSGISADALVTTLLYHNTKTAGANLLMLVAIYGPNGKLLHLGTVNGTVPGLCVNEFVVKLELPGNANGSYQSGHYAVVYLWDGVTFAPVQSSHRFP